MKLYGIINCGSVKKAMNFLDSRHIKYEFIDLKKQPPHIDKITSWVKKAGVDVVLNTKGMTYKKLSLAKENLTQEQKIQKMSEFPLLIKRPVIEYNENLIIGFDEIHYQNIFG
ncbi:Spx/MgsR family RNA polymerase-binding regulatory protein [Helicobacter fennelliae]|uniref:Arsenate reductase n=2 Tax=Helicobacter fennelliae TaxID=215 RepID=T1D3J5_9HELI|nr:Spx/MgsR family RNA polymerase-binding regulatory protein [Helicobacter fennelliae]GAD19801.1 arsenate reductase [Helicobacter fennelliae MRY12-0050]SQB98666.1 arsenate reductase [Helicobacter fennelliae]STP08007.1 arsenate reductase [Helicobacter fennelliae]STQ84084.1 arsenate reductase [Helicobacter fennelliae]